MPNLTPNLNEEQLRQNIDALQKGGLDNTKVQEYVNNYTKSPNGNFVLKVSPPTLTQKIDTGLQKAEDVVTTVFPGKQTGQAIGTLGGLILEKVKGFFGGKDRSADYDISAPSPTQIAGDVASGAASVAGIKGVGTVGKLSQRILINLGLGATIGGGTALAEGQDVKDVVKSAIGTGAIGGAIPVAGMGLRAIGKQIEQLPARFVNSALSRSKAEVLKDIATDKVDDFAKYVVQNKPIGSAKTLLSDSMENINQIDKQVSDALAIASRQSGLKVSIGRNNVLDQVAKLPEAEGALLKRADIRGIIEKLAPQTKQLLQKDSLSLAEANRLRQLVDKTLGDRAFLGGQLSSDKAVLKSFANTLRETVKSKAPEGTRTLFSDFANEIRFRDGLLDRIAKRAGNQVLSFGDFIGGGLGGIFGGGFGGAVAGVAARRAIESVPFKIGASKVINALTKAAPLLDSLAPAQQTAILNLFADIFSEEKDDQTTSLQE